MRRYRYSLCQDPLESNYQLIIDGREKSRNWKFKKFRGIHWYSQTINDVYENLEDYNPIADTESKKKVLLWLNCF